MNKKLICQSCGMELPQESLLGTNADGSRTEKYCCWCYKNGEFTMDATLEGMIAHNLEYLDEFNAVGGTNFTPDEARGQLSEYLPTLERWRK